MTSVRNMARVYAASIAIWLILSVFVAWDTYFVQYADSRRVPLRILLTVAAVRYLTIALLTPPTFYIVARWPIGKGTALRRTTAYVLGFLLFTAAFAVIRWCLLPAWSEEDMRWVPRSLASLWQLAYTKYAEILVLYLVVVGAAHGFAYFVRDRRRELEQLELRHALAQSELQALRVQLQPHFLFNSLQGVSSLIDTDPATAQVMLGTLATLLRTVLAYGSADLISLRSELDFVRAYLSLQGMRLGNRLQVRWQIEPEANEALIPQLLLQPLIENAVVHGSASSRAGGWVEVSAQVRGARLHVQIRNTVAHQSQPGPGVGIRNTRARLLHLYGEDASFELEVQRDTGVARASLVVPAFTATAANQDAVLHAAAE